MRDIKLIYDEGVGFDIDVIDGYPEYVTYENQTQDQRAAISAVIVKGTIPGAEDIGVGWASMYAKDATMLELNNEVNQFIQRNAGGDGTVSSQYIPLYIPQEDGSVRVTVMKGDVI